MILPETIVCLGKVKTHVKNVRLFIVKTILKKIGKISRLFISVIKIWKHILKLKKTQQEKKKAWGRFYVKCGGHGRIKGKYKIKFGAWRRMRKINPDDVDCINDEKKIENALKKENTCKHESMRYDNNNNRYCDDCEAWL